MIIDRRPFCFCSCRLFDTNTFLFCILVSVKTHGHIILQNISPLTLSSQNPENYVDNNFTRETDTYILLPVVVMRERRCHATSAQRQSSWKTVASWNWISEAVTKHKRLFKIQLNNNRKILVKCFFLQNVNMLIHKQKYE